MDPTRGKTQRPTHHLYSIQSPVTPSLPQQQQPQQQQQQQQQLQPQQHPVNFHPQQQLLQHLAGQQPLWRQQPQAQQQQAQQHPRLLPYHHPQPQVLQQRQEDHQLQQQGGIQRLLAFDSRMLPVQPHSSNSIGTSVGDSVPASVQGRSVCPPQVVTTPRSSVAGSSQANFAPPMGENEAGTRGTPEMDEPWGSDVEETYIGSGHSTDDDNGLPMSCSPRINVSTEEEADPISPTVPSGVRPATANTPPSRGGQRTCRPNYEHWTRGELKKEARRLGGRGGLQINPLDTLKSISSASKKDLAEALVRREAWRADNHKPPEWKVTPSGITPVKKASAAKSRTDKAAAPKTLTPKMGYHCRLLCVMNCDRLFQLWSDSRNPPNRAELDAKAIGLKHDFYVQAARAMANPDWTDSNGNSISLPDDHTGDKSAPESLKSRLEGLDLIGPGQTLKNDLPIDSEGNADYLPLQKAIFTWLKEIKQESTKVQERVSVSGGDGADIIPSEDGGDGTETKDAKHLWNFCGGRLPTLIYKDLMRLRAGGEKSGLADAAIPDGGIGAISTVPGNTGTVSTVRGEDAAQPPSTVKRRGKGKGNGTLEEEAEAWSGCKAYLDKLGETEKLVHEKAKLDLARDELELSRERATRHREEAAEVEELAGVLLRISGTVRDLHPDVDPMLRETYQELLDEAKEKLGKARARKKARKAKPAPATEDD